MCCYLTLVCFFAPLYFSPGCKGDDYTYWLDQSCVIRDGFEEALDEAHYYASETAIRLDQDEDDAPDMFAVTKRMFKITDSNDAAFAEIKRKISLASGPITMSGWDPKQASFSLLERTGKNTARIEGMPMFGSIVTTVRLPSLSL